MNVATTTLHSLWQILLVGLVFGCGVPVLFAVGVRLLSSPNGQRRPLHTATAMGCFAVIVIAIALGLLFIMKNFLNHYFSISVF